MVTAQPQKGVQIKPAVIRSFMVSAVSQGKYANNDVQDTLQTDYSDPLVLLKAIQIIKVPCRYPLRFRINLPYLILVQSCFSLYIVLYTTLRLTALKLTQTDSNNNYDWFKSSFYTLPNMVTSVHTTQERMVPYIYSGKPQTNHIHLGMTTINAHTCNPTPAHWISLSHALLNSHAVETTISVTQSQLPLSQF